jgi:hypothetical protein
MRSFWMNTASSLLALTVAFVAGGAAVMPHDRQRRAVTEAGLRREIRENDEGVRDLRSALQTEIKNISDVADLLKAREARRQGNKQAMKLGLAVMAFTDANWRAASATDALESLNYESVEHFSAAYFEQSRLAQLQVTTLDAMMALSSYVGQGELVASLRPEQAGIAEIKARLLLAHLRMMLRMSDGVQGAYKEALEEK